MAEWTFKRDTAFRKQFFVPDSFAHPAKMDAQLLIKIVGDYTEIGDVILDPMAGSGTTMLACMMGRHCVLVELEEKFCKMCRDNWEIVKMHPQLGYGMGSCQIIQGDARSLEGLLADKVVFSPPFAESANVQQQGMVKRGYFKTKEGKPASGFLGKMQVPEDPNNIGNLPYGQVSKIITSPPYAETGIGDWQTPRAEFQAWVIEQLETKGYVEWQSKRYTETEWRAMNHGRLDGRTTKGVHKHPTDGYGKAEGQIGELSYGNIDSIITSPPYEEATTFHDFDFMNKTAQDQRERRMKGLIKGHNFTAEARQRAMRKAESGIIESQANIGNLKSTTYLEAMLQVYRQCYKVLKDGGLMILVVKNFLRNRQEVRLDTDTIKLCEEAGFSYLHRHHRKLPSQSFWRILYMRKYPDAPVIDKEDILVFKKDEKNG